MSVGLDSIINKCRSNQMKGKCSVLLFDLIDELFDFLFVRIFCFLEKIQLVNEVLFEYVVESVDDILDD